ncbi:Selenophosphate-dependent tRNA 2-selenouridine synthase [hydrothermal vent metagenome]|uniref:Selenophosphate-dependent tRNA 2-selenouridine synthase n=1 Tax=hydrothermal vent metagenome TaxID=652676 RepID=A0A1W1EBY5_9ZZZZ
MYNTPLIDVRAPIEFEKGSFPFAVNLPLMNNEERHLVGITYKKEGHESALALGNSLVNGSIKQERIDKWIDFIKNNSNAKLFCFRGGDRSRISQEWIAENRHNIVRLKGGYKAFRTYLMEETERCIEDFEPVVIGGRTGSGKTILLNKLSNAIDLEGLANHRGSSFGRKIVEQPTQINFENSLAYDLIQKLDKGFSKLVFEDEGDYVGRVYIPKILARHIAKAPLIILETSMEKRVDITLDEYVLKAQVEYLKKYADGYLEKWSENIHEAMFRIKRRFGDERYKTVCQLFDNALIDQKKSFSCEKYKEWIYYLLVEYYDPMYDYQIEKNRDRIIFKGSDKEIEEFLKS